MTLRRAPAQFATPFAFAVLFAVACGEPTAGDSTLLLAGDQPRVTIVTSTIEPPGEVRVRLENPTPVEYGYNLCAHGRLQRADGDAWVDLGEPLWLCTAELNALRPGDTQEGGYGIAEGHAEGAYRMRLRLVRDGADLTIYSNSFIVR